MARDLLRGTGLKTRWYAPADGATSVLDAPASATQTSCALPGASTKSIEVVLAMLLAGISNGYLARILPFSLALPPVQTARGAVIAGVLNQSVTLATGGGYVAGMRSRGDPADVTTLPLLMPDGAPLPARDLIVYLATAVTLVSLVAASLGLPPLMQGLSLPPEPAAAQEETLARHGAANTATAAVEKSQRDPLENSHAAEIDSYANAATAVRGLYQEWLHNEDASKERSPSTAQGRRCREGASRRGACRRKCKAISKLARHNRMPDDVSRKLLHENRPEGAPCQGSVMFERKRLN